MDVQELQSALRSLEDDRRKIGDEHTSDRFGLELEIERVKRDLARSDEEAIEAAESLRRLENLLGERDAEIASLVRVNFLPTRTLH
jgi:flagellar motility protein MotE (MotC chaperone)